MPTDIVTTLLAFVLVLGVLITFHEFGHFIVARACGVKILRFSVGFGRPLLMWRQGRDQTEFVLAALPFGGFVKMLDEREGEVPEAERSRAFNRKSLAARSAIVFAGPAFNLILATVVYAMTYVIGVEGTRPLIGAVTPQSVAARAGLQAGDEILSVNGQVTPTWEAVLNAMLPILVADQQPELLVARSTVAGSSGARSVSGLDADSGAGRAAAARVSGTDFETSTGATTGVAKGITSGATTGAEMPDTGPALERTLTLPSRGAVDLDAVSKGDLFKLLGIGLARLEFPAVVGDVIDGEPAAAAGLRAGDRILAVDGLSIADWMAFRARVVASPGEPLRLRVESAAGTRTVVVTPASFVAQQGGLLSRWFRRGDASVPAVGRIGASPETPSTQQIDALRATERYALGPALALGAERTLEMSLMTVQMLKKMLFGDASVSNLSGPLSIAQFAGQSAELGLVPFLSFLALVSVSLGVLNLLPIPVLDGGHLVYYLIEFGFGKSASAWVEGYAQQLGLALLMGLMAVAVYNDVNRLVFGG